MLHVHCVCVCVCVRAYMRVCLSQPLPLPPAYRTEEGKPWVLPVVREVEQRMAADETLDKEYLLQDGMAALREAAVRLVLGSGSRALVQNRVRGREGRGGEGIYLVVPQVAVSQSGVVAVCLHSCFCARCGVIL